MGPRRDDVTPRRHPHGCTRRRIRLRGASRHVKPDHGRAAMIGHQQIYESFGRRLFEAIQLKLARTILAASGPANATAKDLERLHDIVQTTSIGGPKRKSKHGNRSEGNRNHGGRGGLHASPRSTVDFPALRTPRAIGSSSATILFFSASTASSRGQGLPGPRRICLQARIRDSARPFGWPTPTISSFPRGACSSSTKARTCSTL